MALADDINLLAFITSLVLGGIAIFFAFLWIASKVSEGAQDRTDRKHRSRAGDFAARMPRRDYTDTDLRLTYRRFKELYPFSPLTYEEYKQLQGQQAYRRAVGSQKIKRMVR
jgi:hypothetical protein